MLNDLKQDLINKISATDDENLLLLQKTEYDYFARDSKQEVTEERSEEGKAELVSMVNESFGHDNPRSTGMR